MNYRVVGVLFFHLLLALPVYAAPSTDVLVMRNGDHLTCQIKGLSNGTLYVGLPYVIETLSVDWSKVARLESTQLFLVKTEDGAVYRGTLSTAEPAGDRPIAIEVDTDPKNMEPHRKVVLESTEVVNVAVTSGRFHERFTGGVSFGSIYSKGNQSTQYNVSGYAAYPRERWAAQTGISSNLSRANGTPTSTRNQLTFGGTHLLPWNNYFYAGFDVFLQSTEQEITGQNALGGGVGRYLKNTNRTTISLLGGGAWQHTQYNASQVLIPTQDVTAAVIAANAKFFKFDKTNFNVNALILPALSEPGRLFLSTNASYYVKLVGNLSWTVSFYGNWDTQPPGNLRGSDYGTSSGLSWTFGTSLRTTPTTIQ